MSAERTEAQADFRARRYNEAADGYKAIVKSDPDDARAWFRLAYSLHNLKQYKNAITAYDEAADRSYAPHFVLYNKACAEVLLGREKDGLGTLKRAIEAGFTDVQNFKNDSDLNRIRNTDEYAELLQMISEPVGRFPAGNALDVLEGTWALWQEGGPVGRIEYRFATQGFSLNERTIIGTDLVSSLMYYYSKGDGAWLVAGVTEEGTVFDGSATGTSDTVELIGSRKDQTELIQVRKRIRSTGASRALVVTEEREPGGTWAVSQQYEMRKMALAPE